MEEEWRPISGCSNYEVSSLGRIRSKPRPKSRGGVLKMYINIHERYCVDLWGDDKKKHKFQVHRLVAIHFLPNIYGHSQVDHRNTIRTDNRVVNLRWCNGHQNQMNQSIRKNNKSGEKGVSFSKQRNKWVGGIRTPEGKNIQKRFETKEEAIKFRDDMVKAYYDMKFYREF